MTDYRFTFSVLFIVGSMIAQPISAGGADTPTQTTSTQTSQQQGMQDNLEGSIPDSDLKAEQELENPRIAVFIFI